MLPEMPRVCLLCGPAPQGYSLCCLLGDSRSVFLSQTCQVHLEELVQGVLREASHRRQAGMIPLELLKPDSPSSSI